MAHLPHLLNALLIAGAFAYAFATYDSLPERIPVHFDARGQPDGWVGKSLAYWLVLPLVTVGITLFMYAMALLVNYARKHPNLVNMPSKAKFLSLPPQQQEPVWVKLKGILYWLAVPMNVMFIYLMYFIHTTAAGEEPVSFWLGLGVLMAFFLAVIIQTWIGVSRAIREAISHPSARG